ncbi:hypothetical protein KKH13_04765 [Patescibacteria group bacterium]|nr:hypothetical protein [Patescibacteria group bacterium]
MTVPTAAILSELLKTKGLWKLEGANVRPTWLGRKEAEGRYIGRPYNNTQYSIELNPILYRYKNAFEIVLHEIGHYYWFNFLPQEIKDKYNSWHKHLKVLEYQDMDRLYEEIWKYFYTKDASYALTNPRELYAELFSQHIIAKMRSSAKQGVTKRWSIDKKIPAGVAKNLKAILESPPGDFPIRDESVQTFKEMHETLGLSSLGATFEDEELFQAQQPIYTSKLQQELSAMPSNIKPESVKNYLLRKGVKPEEIEWSGLEYNIKPYFDGMLTKEEFINRVNVEVAEYTTKTWVNPEDVAAGIHAGPDYEGYTLAGGSSSYKNIAFYIPTEHPLHGYIPSRKHFGPEGTFAHARVDIRTLSDGRKVLFVEEIQSDAFAGKEPPTAPLAKTWYELVFRRLYRMAAEEGLDGLAWASGEQQREIQRWNLDPENLVRRITGSKVFYDQKLRGYASRFGKQFGVQPGIAPLEGRTDPSNFLPITPEIRETVKNKPIEIFQNEVNKAVLGRFSETAPGAFLINLYNGSDLSTIIHETFHWWVKTQFTPEEFRRAHDIYSNAKTDIEFHEMLANDFQQYLKDGTTRHKHLQSIFLKFRQWLVDMWKNLKGVDEDTALKPEVREFFDSLMADDTITGEDLHNSLVIESDQNEKSVLLQAASIANRNPGAYGVLWEKIKDYLARRTTLSGWFNLHDARNLAKVAPYYASKVEAIEKQYNPILHKIRALLPDKADRTALFLNYDNPKTWSSLPADVRSRLEPVRKLLIKAYEDILKILQSRGIVERDFYETEYLRLQKEEVEAHKKGNTEQAEAIHYQANLIWDPDKNKPKARFQHLPVMFLLDKLRVERPKIFRRVIRTLTNQNRSTLFAADLYDNPTLKKEGISIELADPIIGLGLYISRFARDMAMYDILNAAKQDGMAKYVGNTTLQSTKNEIKRLLQSGEGWIRPSSFAPALRGWVVKDVFASYISEMTQSTESFIPLERIFLLAKMGQFALPFGLSIYNSFQYAMRLGAGRMAWESLKTAAPFLGKSSLRIAVEAKVGNTEDWQTFKNLGASSDPGLNPYVSRLEDLKRISKGFTGDFALHLASIVLRGGYEKAGKYTETGLLLEPWQKAIDVFKGYDESKSKALTALGLPVSAIKGWYQASYKVAWELEELTRFALYDNLLKKGFSSEQAVEQTRLFIGDYADIPRRTRRILNGILFTPSFQMSMARLFLYMIKDTGRVFFDSVRGLPIDKQEQAYAAGLLHTIGILFAMDLLMHAFGFDTEEFGYKYKKKVKTDRGDKDFIWTFPSPVSFLVKYAYRTQRIFNGDPTQSEGQRYVNEFKWQLHPIYLVAWQTLNGKTLNGQEIYSTFDNPIVKRGKSLLFASGSIFRILQIAALTPQGPLGYEVPLYMETGMDDKEAREVIDKEFTALMKVISFTGYGVQHLRAPKEIRAAAQIRRLQAQLLTKAKKSVQDPRYKITEKQMENFRKQIKDVIDSIRD